MARAGLKKVVKTVRGKRGTVKRTYWVKTNPTVKGLRSAGPEKGPGFLRRHAGKILGAAALVGGAYIAHKHGHGIAGAFRGASAAHGLHQGEGLKDRLKAALGGASSGYHNKKRDLTGAEVRGHLGDGATAARAKFASARESLSTRTAGARAAVTAYRRGIGADLAGHMTKVGGEAAAHHIGSHFGTVAGTAIGGLAGGGVGAGVGGFLGGHAGGYLAGRHTEKHIIRAAQWAQERLQR